MFGQTQLPPLDQRIVVDARGPGEWIVAVPAGGRSLHVYMLAPADWLVSEVGRGSEGRGTDLKQALAVLSGGASSPDWWDVVAAKLDPDEKP
jgi:sarcosine oxidase gamma subunit